MATVKTTIFARKVGIVEPGDPIVVMQVVVIKLTVGVMPQLIVAGNDCLMIVERPPMALQIKREAARQANL